MFCQTQQMLDILEKFAGQAGYAYHRMDGSTTVSVRARLIDDFNCNDQGARAGGGGQGAVGSSCRRSLGSCMLLFCLYRT